MTDYALPSQLMADMSTELDPVLEPAFYQSILDLLAGASSLIESQCDRRFDHRIETINHDARQQASGGDVVGRALVLRDDLLSVTEIVNNGVTLAPSDYLLIPQGNRAPCKTLIQLTQTYSAWTWADSRPYDAIGVTGIWGYGGRWKLAGTLTASLGAGDLAITASAPTALENRGVIRIDDEYLTIDEYVTANPLTVERAVNGSAAAAHSNGAAIYKFIPDALVTRLCLRLARWLNALSESPLVGVVSVGDYEQPIDLTAIPQDAKGMIDLLKRKESIGAA